MWKSDTNHATNHGPGAIVLTASVCDLWLSEMLISLRLQEEEARKLLEKEPVEKNRALYKL